MTVLCMAKPNATGITEGAVVEWYSVFVTLVEMSLDLLFCVCLNSWKSHKGSSQGDRQI